MGLNRLERGTKDCKNTARNQGRQFVAAAEEGIYEAGTAYRVGARAMGRFAGYGGEHFGAGAALIDWLVDTVEGVDRGSSS